MTQSIESTPIAQALGHFQAIGYAVRTGRQAPAASASWADAFRKGLMAILRDDGAWQHVAYFEALRHESPDVRKGIRVVMGEFCERGLRKTRQTVFGLFCDVTSSDAHAIGELESYEPLLGWLAGKLGVSRHAIRCLPTARAAG